MTSPGYLNATTENPGTRSVEMYNVKTLDTQRRVPKVTKLNGNNRRFKRGFMSMSTKVSANPPPNNILGSFPNCSDQPKYKCMDYERF